MMKKLIAILLAGSTLLSTVLTGCDSPSNDETESMATYQDSQETVMSEPEYSEETIEETEVLSVMQEETILSPSFPEKNEDIEIEFVEENENLTTPQRNDINMLNYITVLTQEINVSKSSRIYLDSVQSSLLNNLNLNAIDSKTQSQINNLWKTIDGYRMISVKRERLEYIYEQNKAQALREAIPNPVGLLSAVQSGDKLSLALSVLYMAVDSVASYESSFSKADLDYLKDNWELDNEETDELSSSQLNLLNYMINVVRDNALPNDCALKPEEVEAFVEWANKENLTRRISWFEEHEETYSEFRTYWTELAKTYYQYKNYEKCLEAVKKFEEVATPIFDYDTDYAETLLTAILSAKEIMSQAEYVEYAERCVELLLANCPEKEWGLRYFAAQIYIDLCANTGDSSYLKNAFDIAKNNVNVLMDEQVALNSEYLNEVQKLTAAKDATKREKKEIDEYNALIKEKRKTELPPVSEAFYLNCELLFALVEELDIPQHEKDDIDAILHENGTSIFLTEALDNRFWADESIPEIDSDDILVSFDGSQLTVPANCLTEKFEIQVTISDDITIDDWEVKEVHRPKGSKECSEFMVTLTSEEGKQHTYSAGEKITVTVIPSSNMSDNTIDFNFQVNSKKTLWIFNGIEIERITK